MVALKKSRSGPSGQKRHVPLGKTMAEKNMDWFLYSLPIIRIVYV